MAGFKHIAIGGTVAFALAAATATAAPLPLFDVSGLPLFTPVDTVEAITITAENINNTVDTTYTGTVHFTSNPGLAILPLDYTFLASEDGTHTFSVEFLTLGPDSITATDTSFAAITGTDTTTVIGAASIPEPASLTLLAMGLAGLGMLPRTRRA